MFSPIREQKMEPMLSKESRYAVFKESLFTELQKYGKIEGIVAEMQSKGILDILFDVLREICQKEYKRIASGTPNV